MVKHSMDLLELLRKRGMDGDVDFLRESRVVTDSTCPTRHLANCRSRSASSWFSM